MEAGQGLRYPYPLLESQSAPSENVGCRGANSRGEKKSGRGRNPKPELSMVRGVGPLATRAREEWVRS